jgi:hypothetical protein
MAAFPKSDERGAALGAPDVKGGGAKFRVAQSNVCFTFAAQLCPSFFTSLAIDFNSGEITQ